MLLLLYCYCSYCSQLSHVIAQLEYTIARAVNENAVAPALITVAPADTNFNTPWSAVILPTVPAVAFTAVCLTPRPPALSTPISVYLSTPHLATSAAPAASIHF